jgi:epoxyqueuosine reductase QueG
MSERAHTKGREREERQAQVDRRVAELRSQAVAKFAEAARIQDTVNDDSAFWTQPAYSNAAGRAFARSRDRERGKIQRAAGIAAEAEELSKKADRLEERGAVMAGDTQRKREEVIAACDVKPGDLVDTTLYGVRRVLKVNRKTVAVEGGLGPLTVCKSFITPAKGGNHVV